MEMRPLSIEGIGKKILKYRRYCKLSQESLAEAVGIDASMLSKIENGRKSNLTVDLLIQIAEVFHVTMDDLCYDTGTDLISEDKKGSLLADQVEAARILESLSDIERFFLMKMLRGAA